jgi:membrane protease YdiL (CAAX protease family)
MQKNNFDLVESRVPGTWGSLLVLVGFMLIGMALGNVIALGILAIFYSADASTITTLLNQLITNPSNVPDGWSAMMILQGTVHFCSYLLPALLYWWYIERKSISDFEVKNITLSKLLLPAFLLVMVFMPLNSKFIEWNASMTLPESLSGIEIWMREKEDQLAMLTAFLTSYNQPIQLFTALFVVAFLPAWGEETLFRGIIQRKLVQQLGNPHIAIWLSAAIFSAIHFQFYGFLPRMLLGAVFGYLYYWTGSLRIAVFAHFINNGFVLVMMYLYNIKALSVNIEEMKGMPWPLVVASIAATSFILFIVRKQTSGTKVIR